MPAAMTRIGRANPARVFASVDIHGELASAASAWAELAAVSPASGYQSQAFAAAYLSTIGAEKGITPFIVVARDERGVAVALLPLGQRRLGRLRCADFLGGAWANYRMGLFRPGLVWRAEDVAALLTAAARLARPRIDVFLLWSQPEGWDGVSNPLAALPRQPSPSFARASHLPARHQAWVDAHFSKSTQKKQRKKAKKLESFGAVQHRSAGSTAEARDMLQAYFDQRRARADAGGLPQARPEAVAMLQRLASFEPGAPELEMHALYAGERIAATFGALRSRARLSGVILSFNSEPEFAPASPGELLVIEVARDAIARGFADLDLGAGESRYKNECCEIEEPLFDSALGVTLAGRLAAPAALALARAKRAIKRRPKLYALARRLQGLRRQS